MRFVVELSGENRPLAGAELEGALRAVGGRPIVPLAADRLVEIDLPAGGRTAAAELVQRLAFGRRILAPLSARTVAELERAIGIEGARSGGSASFRPLGRERGQLSKGLLDRLGGAWIDAGGSISLSAPSRRFLVTEEAEAARAFEEVGRVDRAAFDDRRLGRLPFRRPVSLKPRLARAAANIAAIRPGDRVVDPFCGTGGLLIEAALLGAHVWGADRAPEMIRGADRNLAHLGLVPERLTALDAEVAAAELPEASVDVLLTDPPYGRSAGSFGEPPEQLVRRALGAWWARLRPGGRLVLVVPQGSEAADPSWPRLGAWVDRVHRSLTREFSLFERPSNGDARQLPSSPRALESSASSPLPSSGGSPRLHEDGTSAV